MSAAPIPKTAPFADDEIEVLNRVVGPATPVQRAWLAGFLAGLDAQQGGAAANDALPAAAPQTAEPLTILYATESGNSEKLAGDVAKSARKLGFKPSLVDMADLDVASLKDVKRLIVIAATWGEGEPPARATRAYKELMSDAAPRLDGVEFGVLALGDTAYVEFCAIGKALDERLEALGGKRVADRVDCDLDFAEPAAKWIDGTLKVLAPEVAPDAKVIAVDFGAKAAPNLDVVEAEVTEHINLNSSRSDKETDPPRTDVRRRRARLQAGRLARPLCRERSGLRRCAAARRRGCRPTRRCARTSSRAATSPRSRSRRWRPMRASAISYVKELLDAGDGEELDRRAASSST